MLESKKISSTISPFVIDDNTACPHNQCLGAHTELVCALKHLVPSCQGPCTHKVGSWSHHLVNNAEDPANDVEDLGDGVEVLVEDGETLDGFKKH